jgi:hypothetical protein
MDLADKLGALSLKNASIQETGASLKTKILRPEEEFRIPKNFKYPFGMQIIKFARLVGDLLSSKFQKASLSQFKRLNRAVGSLNAIFNTSANFERRQLDSLRQSIFLLDCYFEGNSSKEGISLKKKVTPQTNKMLKSIESRIEIQASRNEIKRDKTSKQRKLQKEFNCKKFSKQRQEERERRKRTSFPEIDEYANCHFWENSNFSPPSSFSSI